MLKGEELEELLKTHDLEIGDHLIELSGNYEMMESHNGIAIETNREVSSEILEYYKIVDKSPIFDNYITLSIQALNASSEEGKFVKVDKSNREDTGHKKYLEELDKAVKKFEEVNKNNLEVTRLSMFGLEGSAVTYSSEGSLFSLEDPKKAEFRPHETVLRVLLDLDTLKIISNPRYSGRFFTEIKEEMESKGCTSYTFTPPDGGSMIRRKNLSKLVELRAYGYSKGEND